MMSMIVSEVTFTFMCDKQMYSAGVTKHELKQHHKAVTPDINSKPHESTINLTQQYIFGKSPFVSVTVSCIINKARFQAGVHHAVCK